MRNPFLVLTMALCFGASLFAQTSGWTSGVIEFYSDESQVSVLDSQGHMMDSLYIGLELLAGDTIKTKNSTVELRLVPGGSLIRISPNTIFKIETLPSPKTKDNTFALADGKIRVLAIKSKGSSYTFKTPTAVAGVRGTEFGLEVEPGKTEVLVVREGLVEFTQLSTKTTIPVASQQSADTFQPQFVPVKWEPSKVEEFFTAEDQEAQKKDEAQLAAEEAARKIAQQKALSDEEEQKRAAREEEDRLAEIRKAGSAAMAAEAERQKERDRIAQESADAEILAKAEAERLQVQFMKGMIYLEGGTFTLGDQTGQGSDNEQPTSYQRVQAFYLAQNVLTMGEFRNFVNDTGYRTTAEKRRGAYTSEGNIWAQRMARSWKFPGYKPNPKDPARCLSWYDAVAYCNWLSVKQGKTPAYRYPGHGSDTSTWPSTWNLTAANDVKCDTWVDGFRLPTEIEWEYAAKGGKQQDQQVKKTVGLGFSNMLRVGEWTQDLFLRYGQTNKYGQVTNKVVRGLAQNASISLGPSTRSPIQPEFAGDSVCIRICLPAAK